MQHFFLTDQNNKDWLGRTWVEESSWYEENDNYYFITFPNPLIALFMNPAYDEVINPKVWLADIGGNLNIVDFRTHSSRLTIHQPLELTPPTQEQHITFGIVCALNLISNLKFCDWAFQWLQGEDRTIESATKMMDILLNTMLKEPDEVYSAHAAIAAVALDKPLLYSACAAHRAWHDSLIVENGKIDLNQIATVVTMLSSTDIGKMLQDT